MSGFAIYNYNFLRIIRPNEEYQLEFPRLGKSKCARII